MSVQLNPYIEQLSWAEARELILPVNPEFVRHADELELLKECCIFKVQYRYGDYLLQKGRLMLRNFAGANVDIDDPSLPKILKEKLQYAKTIPMGINTNKKIEIFFEGHDGRVVPIMSPEPGYIFALSGVLSKKNSVSLSQGPFWNITAGIRQIYSVPKISITVKHKKLAKEFGINPDAPDGLSAHWGVFKELMQSEKLNSDWTLDILFFSEEFPRLKDSPDWLNFNNYLREYSWDSGDFLRTFYQASYITSEVAAYANVPASPNLINTIKQVISVAGGFLPGLALNPEEAEFPKKIISKIYRDIYSLEYAPLFMGTRYFSPQKFQNIFYSLALPNMLEYYATESMAKSKFEDLRNLAHALEKIQNLIKKNSLHIPDLEKSFFRGLTYSDIQCYHSHSETEKNIRHTSEIIPTAEEDQRICRSSSILRGLVGIQPKG